LLDDADETRDEHALSDQERSMMLDELAREPRVLLAGSRGSARSPFCGDEVTVAVQITGSTISDISWDGHGCTVSMAAAAAMSHLAPITVPTFRKVFAVYGASLNGPDALGQLANDDKYADLAAFSGIGRFPLRATCATVAWDAAVEAIANAEAAR
jgi:nitrogen fixation protein NifU and related proteins